MTHVGNPSTGREFGITPQTLPPSKPVSLRELDAFKGEIWELYQQYPVEVVQEKMKNNGIYAR
jgi:hypothetical protein